jgi:hypothetical protein
MVNNDALVFFDYLGRERSGPNYETPLTSSRRSGANGYPSDAEKAEFWRAVDRANGLTKPTGERCFDVSVQGLDARPEDLTRSLQQNDHTIILAHGDDDRGSSNPSRVLMPNNTTAGGRAVISDSTINEVAARHNHTVSINGCYGPNNPGQTPLIRSVFRDVTAEINALQCRPCCNNVAVGVLFGFQ